MAGTAEGGATAAEMTEEQKHARFTTGLIFDVVKVLEEHGYRQNPEASTMGRVMGDLFRLVHDFEGEPMPGGVR